MNVYLDTSVVLSRLLCQSNALASWGEWEACYTSTLTRVEFFRTIDRLRLNGALTDEERVELQRQFNVLWESVHRVTLTQGILDEVCASMPTVLGTLDAIHLVTALQVSASRRIELTFLTHDRQLLTGARAMGLDVPDPL